MIRRLARRLAWLRGRPGTPAPGGSCCPVCWHVWTLHGQHGCTAQVLTAMSLERRTCSCQCPNLGEVA